MPDAADNRSQAMDRIEKNWFEEVRPPDSTIATRARELCMTVAPPFLANHSARTFAWGCLLARSKRIHFDRELFYVAAVLHDLGLTVAFAGPRCFEHESAAAAGRFAAGQGWDPERRALLSEAIRLHMQVRVILEDGSEAWLLAESTGCDVTGRGLNEVDPTARHLVLEQFPRLDFKVGFLSLLEDEARHKPGCMADHYLGQGLKQNVLDAPFDS